jgi:hypothetical protein
MKTVLVAMRGQYPQLYQRELGEGYRVLFASTAGGVRWLENTRPVILDIRTRWMARSDGRILEENNELPCDQHRNFALGDSFRAGRPVYACEVIRPDG